jgi:hypothetical protein
MLWPDGGKNVEGFYYPIIQGCKKCPPVMSVLVWYAGIWEKIGGR